MTHYSWPYSLVYCTVACYREQVICNSSTVSAKRNLLDCYRIGRGSFRHLQCISFRVLCPRLAFYYLFVHLVLFLGHFSYFVSRLSYLVSCFITCPLGSHLVANILWSGTLSMLSFNPKRTDYNSQISSSKSIPILPSSGMNKNNSNSGIDPVPDCWLIKNVACKIKRFMGLEAFRSFSMFRERIGCCFWNNWVAGFWEECSPKRYACAFHLAVVCTLQCPLGLTFLGSTALCHHSRAARPLSNEPNQESLDLDVVVVVVVFISSNCTMA